MEIDTLDQERRDTLLNTWRQLFGHPPPKGLSSPFLRRFIAFELQSRRQPGLPKDFRRKLARATGGQTTRPSSSLKPGGRLLREWHGVTHVVEVTQEGFRWKGQTHRSLSAIAREITGARWSGPRFFGLSRRSRS
ncbi:DUF2924 domain-containing protein [Sulfitobacter sp. JBTF-M27]|uniref:DUF2924 domain-containing protein n=1 Tax=Sulfitobacter sediminilitoris TaxID=2698830 RepID=A0A6P0CFB5_9RHOB|nr:DUF2924 domain-containing protein [Sulfitobacter sediminilitoris]NEK23918.1 DUF2924 domain-containing protein [Sulfitobacter sediminilitoris]